MSRTTETRDIGIVAAFTQQPEGYLGDPATVGDALRLMLVEALEIREAYGTGEIVEADLARRLTEPLRKAAKILLGQEPSHRRVIGWNQPGGIDAHLAKELNLPDADPEDRVVNALWHLVKEICLLVAQEEQGMPEENTRWQMDAAIDQHTKLLLGLPMDKPGPEDE